MTCFACDNQEASEGKKGQENITSVKLVYLNGVSQGILIMRAVARHTQHSTLDQATEIIKRNLCSECQTQFDVFIKYQNSKLNS